MHTCIHTYSLHPQIPTHIHFLQTNTHARTYARTRTYTRTRTHTHTHTLAARSPARPRQAVSALVTRLSACDLHPSRTPLLLPLAHALWVCGQPLAAAAVLQWSWSDASSDPNKKNQKKIPKQMSNPALEARKLWSRVREALAQHARSTVETRLQQWLPALW